MPKVLIAQSAWQVITTEVGHFARQNKEAMVYPLFSFIRNPDCLKKPWSLLDLDDLQYFVITHAFAPPRQFCRHTSITARLKFPHPETEQSFYAPMKKLCERYPALDIGYVHSHQFATGQTWPSDGEDCDYPRIYSLWEHLRNKKLNTPLEIIISKKLFGGWQACAFGFDKKQEVVGLDRAEIIADNDDRIKQVLFENYLNTWAGHFWSWRIQKQAPIEAVDAHNFGWQSIRIRSDATQLIFVHLPPHFPKSESVLVQILNLTEKKWGEMQIWPNNNHWTLIKDVVKKKGALDGNNQPERPILLASH